MRTKHLETIDCFVLRKIANPIVRFRNHAVSNNDGVSLCLLHRFDAISTQAVNTFARCPNGYIGHIKAAAALARTGFKASKETDVKKHSRGGTLPKDCAQGLKQLFPIATTNLTKSC